MAIFFVFCENTYKVPKVVSCHFIRFETLQTNTV